MYCVQVSRSRGRRTQIYLMRLYCHIQKGAAALLFAWLTAMIGATCLFYLVWEYCGGPWISSETFTRAPQHEVDVVQPAEWNISSRRLLLHRIMRANKSMVAKIYDICIYILCMYDVRIYGTRIYDRLTVNELPKQENNGNKSYNNYNNGGFLNIIPGLNEIS